MLNLLSVVEGDILTQPGKKRGATSDQKSAGPKSSDGLLERALRLINHCACDGLTMEELLDALWVSRSTLERVFWKLGRTPAQEIKEVRCMHAKQLLADTKLPMKQIAQMVGFSRVSSFCIFFRNQSGQSPSDFRSDQRGPLIGKNQTTNSRKGGKSGFPIVANRPMPEIKKRFK